MISIDPQALKRNPSRYDIRVALLPGGDPTNWAMLIRATEHASAGPGNSELIPVKGVANGRRP